MTSEASLVVRSHFSRRSLLLLFATSPVAALFACRTPQSSPGPGPDTRAADAQLDRVAQSYDAIARQDRNLPGVRSLAGLGEELFAGFDMGDRTLLAAALHLQARERVVRARRPIGEADVRAVLSSPIDISSYGRPFLERTLAEAKARAATDPRYRRELDSAASARRPCRNSDTGASIPGWLCVLIVIAIVLIIVLA